MRPRPGARPAHPRRRAGSREEVVSVARRRAQRRDVRAFTIMELMVVLAIILGIAAIALPLALDDAKRAAFGEAEQQLEAILLSARADSQRTGKTVRVRGVELDDRWLLIEEEVIEESGTDGAAARGGGEAGPRTRVIQESALPARVRLARTREEAEGKSDRLGQDVPAEDDGGPGEDLAAVDATRGSAALQVAMFLPDGQIVPTRPLHLGGPDGRVGEVSVNSWTGAVTVAVLAARSSEPGDEGEGPDIDGEKKGEGGNGKQEP